MVSELKFLDSNPALRLLPGRLQCPRVHCLAGLTSEPGSEALYQQNLERAVRVLGAAGVEARNANPEARARAVP